MENKILKDIEFLSEIIESIFSTLELQSALDVIAEKATIVLGADATSIMLTEKGMEDLRIRATYNLSEEYVNEMTEKIGDEISVKVVKDGKPLYMTDIKGISSNKKYKRYLRFVKKEGFESVISLPISSRQGNIGAINIFFKKPSCFTKKDKKLLTFFTNFISIAISHVTFFEDRKRKIRALEALNLIGQKISSISTEFESVVEVVYAETSKIMKTENFYLALYDREKNEIRFALYVEEGKRIERKKRKLKQGLTEHVIRTQSPLLLTSNVAERLRKLGIKALGRPSKSWLGVPILYGRRILGVIGVQDYEKENIYDEDDMSVLFTIANQAAVAIEASRLYEKTKDMAIRDPMTGLFNVRHLYNVLELEIERAKRYNLSFSILIIDIDNFKGFNDRLGHLAGDELLKQYGRFLFDNSRKADTVARYGGDEFIIVLSLTGKENAVHLSKRIMNKLKKHKFSVDSEKISLKVTVGEASFPQDGRTSEKLIRKADRALLEGKKEKHIKNQKNEN